MNTAISCFGRLARLLLVVNGVDELAVCEYSKVLLVEHVVLQLTARVASADQPAGRSPGE
jgi:hypothetical protein